MRPVIGSTCTVMIFSGVSSATFSMSTPPSVEAMKAALKTGSAAARASEFVIFPEAPHAFHADYRPSYREQAAQDGWARMLTWFNQHGVA